MYIFVKRTPTKKYGLTLIAELRATYRLCGEPRSKLVSYLGSIKQTRLPFDAARHFFWKQVDAKMRAVPNMTDAIFDRLTAKLEEHVPRT
jgi:hypothetical protein